jgi:hypothetical protein
VTDLQFTRGDVVRFVGHPCADDDPPTGAVGEVLEEVYDDGRTDVRLGARVLFLGGCSGVFSDDELEPAA